MSGSEDDTWLESEIEAERATGPAGGALIGSIARALQDAPADRRYDITLDVTERERDD